MLFTMMIHHFGMLGTGARTVDTGHYIADEMHRIGYHVPNLATLGY